MSDKILIAGLVVIMAGSSYLAYQDKEVSPVKENPAWTFSNSWEEAGVSKTPVVSPPSSPLSKVERVEIVAKTYSEALVLSKEKGMPIFLFFSADWCNWCTKMKTEVLPKVDKSKYIFCEINADKNSDLVKKYTVQYLPTYVIINGKEEKLKDGSKFMSVENLTAWLNNPSFYNQEKGVAPEIEVKPDSKPLIPPPKKIIPKPRKWLFGK